MQKVKQIENVIIPSPEKLEKIKRLIKAGGGENLYVLSDFDRTLTKAFVNGECRPSLISILRDEGYLASDYGQKARDLYNKYHAIEVDRDIPLAKRKKMMARWWRAHFSLLLKSGLNKKDVERAVKSKKIKFRDGFCEFVGLLRRYQIPLVILSSGGLGKEAVSMCLEKVNVLYDNIHIVSNSYIWDKKGNAVGLQKPIIHSLNKNEIKVRRFPEIYKRVKNRRNVILLGDNREDTAMTEGFKFGNLLKVGFLNERVEENLKEYKRCYDVLILDDGGMKYINDLLKEILKRG